MHFKLVLFQAAAFYSVITGALPAGQVHSKRQDPPIRGRGIYWCRDTGWKDCIFAPLTTVGDCMGGMTFSSSSSSDISAIGPDQGVHCAVFEKQVCGGKSLDIQYPGYDYPQLQALGWNDRIKSYACSWD